MRPHSSTASTCAACRSLAEVVAVLRGDEDAPGPHVSAARRCMDAEPRRARTSPTSTGTPAGPGADDRGGRRSQPAAVAGRRASARRCSRAGLPSILPPLTQRRGDRGDPDPTASPACTAGDGLVTRRPFRAPHHQISPRGLVGGGSVPTPGRGVAGPPRGPVPRRARRVQPRSALEALRQPLEDGRVAIVRSQRVAVYPTRFMLVALDEPVSVRLRGRRALRVRRGGDRALPPQRSAARCWTASTCS